MNAPDRQPTQVTLHGLTKRFGATIAVDDLDLSVEAGSFAALLGPSGCGKSTTLAMVAGLEQPDAGDVRFAGTSVLGVTAERRPVGLVRQKALLFPHLDVAANVGFGLRMRGLGRQEIAQRVAAMLERVQLGGLARRRVGELSGGQEQRVALARALVLEPAVLLLDEPFSSLDAALRAEMRRLVRQLHDESAVTTLFVTHDQAEAVEVADTVALLLDGRLAGSGSPDLFYRQPPSLAAARFFGVTNEIPGRAADGEFRADDGDLRVRRVHSTATAGSGTSLGADGFAGGRAVLVIRPEAVQLSPTDREEGTVIGRVIGARFAGTHLAVEVAVSRSLVLVAHRPIAEPVTVGAGVGLRLPPEACSVFADPGGRA